MQVYVVAKGLEKTLIFSNETFLLRIYAVLRELQQQKNNALWSYYNNFYKRLHYMFILTISFTVMIKQMCLVKYKKGLKWL